MDSLRRSRTSTPFTAMLIGMAILLPVLGYFGLFGLIMLDELVLGTYWFSEYTPPSVVNLLEIIYWPLLRLFD